MTLHHRVSSRFGHKCSDILRSHPNFGTCEATAALQSNLKALTALGSLGLLPRKLLATATSLPGVSVEKNSTGEDVVGVDPGSFNESAYLDLAYRLLDFTRARLTTSAVASYLLKSARASTARTILVLGSSSEEDYVRDMLVHGLRSLPGLRVAVARKPVHMYAPGGGRPRSALYGSGFTYAGWIPDDESMELQSRKILAGGVRQAIKNQRFDLVVYGSVHRGLPFLRDVLHAYPKEKIVFVDGEDEHGWAGGWCASAVPLMRMGHYFLREMPDGCPPVVL